jgi:hypothetical protein
LCQACNLSAQGKYESLVTKAVTRPYFMNNKGEKQSPAELVVNYCWLESSMLEAEVSLLQYRFVVKTYDRISGQGVRIGYSPPVSILIYRHEVGRGKVEVVWCYWLK